MASNMHNASAEGASTTTHLNVQPPNFAPISSQTQQAVATRGTPATLNLDDIFGDCFFTPEGDAVFLSETTPGASGGNNQEINNGGVQVSGENVVANVASRPVEQQQQTTQGQPQQQFVQVPYGGGIATTGLDQTGNVRATVMGAPTQQQPQQNITPMQNPPQQSHHLQFATFTPAPAPVPKTVATNLNIQVKAGGRGSSSRDRKMSDQQKSERRERNREHAKRSRIRKKFLLESLQQSVTLLKEENEKLRSSIRENLGDATADELLTKENLMKDKSALTNSVPGVAGGATSTSLIASNSNDANKVLDDPDFSFIKALQTAQQNFVVTDPSLPDNPIVYATQGFLNLTGYSLDQVLGRNCRFLQGPETDPRAVEKIRKSIEDGTDMSVCLLNYRVDGTTFWNQFFIAALRDSSGNITNYVGVQCKVSDQYAASVCKKQYEEDNVQSATAAPAATTVDAQQPEAQPQVQMQMQGVQEQPQAQVQSDVQPQVQAQMQVSAQAQVQPEIKTEDGQVQQHFQAEQLTEEVVMAPPQPEQQQTPIVQVKTEDNSNSNVQTVHTEMET